MNSDHADGSKNGSVSINSSHLVEETLTIEEKIIEDIEKNPIKIIGDPVTLSHCPSSCNSNGIC